jgi:ribonuclease P protein component
VERAQRLRKGDQFDTAYREGTVIGGPLLVVRYRANSLDVTRWGFAVGKRLAKHAVDRNRLKRRLREAVARIQVLPGADVIVTARAGALTAEFADLQTNIERALGRAELLVDSETP